MSIKGKDFGSNKELEEKTDSFKESNSLENYQLNDLLVCILDELKQIKKELQKINK